MERLEVFRKFLGSCNFDVASLNLLEINIVKASFPCNQTPMAAAVVKGSTRGTTRDRG